MLRRREFTNLLSHYTHIAREVISLRVVVNLQQLQIQALSQQNVAAAGGEGNQFFGEGEDGNTISPEQQVLLLQQLVNATGPVQSAGAAEGAGAGEGAGDGAAAAVGAGEAGKDKSKKKATKSATVAAASGSTKGKRTRSSSSISSVDGDGGASKRRRGSRDAGKQVVTGTASAMARPRRSSRS